MCKSKQQMSSTAGRLTMLSMAVPAALAVMTHTAMAQASIGNATSQYIWNTGDLTVTGNLRNLSAGPALAASGTLGSLSNSGTIAATATYGIGVNNLGSISSLNNIGTITAGSGGDGIHNYMGSISTLNNMGAITAANSGIGIDNAGTIGTLTNSGAITVTGSYGIGVWNDSGTIDTFTNSGSISDGIFNAYNGTSGTISALVNTGTITGKTALYNNGVIGTLINSGTITGTTWALRNDTSGTISSFTNSGVIEGAIQNAASMNLSINGGTGTIFGTLTGSGSGAGSGNIGTITNTSSNLIFGIGNQLLNDKINVGTGTVTNSAGTVQINNVISITGNYQQNAGATLAIGVADGAVSTGSTATDGGYGRLVVSGNAAFSAGSSVTLKALNAYPFAQGQRFVVVQAAAATYNPALLNYSVAGYNGAVMGTSVADSGKTDLLLTVGALNAATNGNGTSGGGTSSGSTATNSGSASNFLPVSSATSDNAASALAGLFRYSGVNPALLSVFNPAAALSSSAAANSAGAQLSPAALSGATAQASAAATQTVIDVAAAHIDSLRVAQAGGTSGVSTGETDHNPALWGQAFGGQATQNTRDGVSGYRASYGGLLMGADAPVTERWRAGGLFAYSDTSLSNNGDNSGSGGHIQSYGLTGYASYTGNPWYINLMAGAATQHDNTTRTVSFTGFSGVNTGSFNGMQYTTAVQGGYPLNLDRWISGTTLTPLVGLSYSHLRQNGYTESGSASALNVNASNSNSLRSEVGGKLSRQFVTAYGTLVPSVELDWRHQYQNTRIQSGASFTADATGATTFTTQSASPIANTGVLNLGVTLLKGRNLSVSAQYVLEAASGYTAQTGDVQVRWQY
jgi:outer membrane autotransporter protein